MRVPKPNFTQAPNELFDEWLPLLSHVELKVLMAIMRKTFGWHKVRDRISLSQLEKITGAHRKYILPAVENLQKLGLIFKEVTGEKGKQNTFYELVVIDDSNNFDQLPNATPPSCLMQPTKETLYSSLKEINKEKKTPRSARPTAATKITLNKEKRCFEGIAIEDMKAWRDAYPAVNVDKELKECVEWALSTPRLDYRKSILTWLRNTQKNHTTPFVTPDPKNAPPISEEDIKQNKENAIRWEQAYQKKRVQHYSIDAHPQNISFSFPNFSSTVSYNMSQKEFNNKCRTAMKRIKLENLVPGD